jgi:pimeloyl-ACP methyl ester carboxylesterase
MHVTVNGHSTYVYTGGKPVDAASLASKQTVVFVHGAIHDHSVWILQSRFLAHHGWNVLAIDLPGHARSEGAPPESIGAAADWLLQFLEVVGADRVSLVGHSMGSLIALEAAARSAANSPSRIASLVLIGTAAPMKVSPALLQASVDAPSQALQMVNVFSRSTLAAPPSALGPGTWVFGSSMALGRRVIESNRSHNVFHAGFKACNDYADGVDSMAKVACPVLFILGQDDQMTPPKAAQSLVQAARNATVVTVGSGHHQMTEAPEATLAALRQFLERTLRLP